MGMISSDFCQLSFLSLPVSITNCLIMLICSFKISFSTYTLPLGPTVTLTFDLLNKILDQPLNPATKSGYSWM